MKSLSFSWMRNSNHEFRDWRLSKSRWLSQFSRKKYAFLDSPLLWLCLTCNGIAHVAQAWEDCTHRVLQMQNAQTQLRYAASIVLWYDWLSIVRRFSATVALSNSMQFLKKTWQSLPSKIGCTRLWCLLKPLKASVEFFTASAWPIWLCGRV